MLLIKHLNELSPKTVGRTIPSCQCQLMMSFKRLTTLCKNICKDI